MSNHQKKRGRPYKFGDKVKTVSVGIRVPEEHKSDAEAKLKEIQESYFIKLETDEKE